MMHKWTMGALTLKTRAVLATDLLLLLCIFHGAQLLLDDVLKASFLAEVDVVKLPLEGSLHLAHFFVTFDGSLWTNILLGFDFLLIRKINRPLPSIRKSDS